MEKVVVGLLIFTLFFAGCFEQDTDTELQPLPPQSPQQIDDEMGEQEQINQSLNETQVEEEEEELNQTANQTQKEDDDIEVNETITEDEIETKHTQSMHMVFMDVGYGDATLIKWENINILLDAGPDGQTIKSRLESLNISRIDLLVLSTWDEQKVGGVRTILRDFDVQEVWTSQQVPANFAFETIREYVDKQQVLITNPKVGESYEYGDIMLEVYNPQEEEYLDYADANSIVLSVNYDDFCAFLPSDLEQAMEQPTIGAIGNKTCPIYKWRNHGEARPQPSVLFDRVSPAEVIISVGQNERGFPSSTTIQRLGIARVGVYRTDIDGNIYVNVSRSGQYIIEPYTELQKLAEVWN